MIGCDGCKHLVAFGTACNGNERRTGADDQASGVALLRSLRRSERYAFCPTPAEMRREGGGCGPGRQMYQPGLAVRATAWILGGP